MEIAVLTGASAGLGKAFFNAYLQNGPKVDEIWLIARRKERLEALAASTEQKVRVLPLDLVKEESITVLQDLLETEKPQVKALINNAGFGKMGYVYELSPAEQGGMVELNCPQIKAGEDKLDYVEYRIIRHINKNLGTELTLKELCDTFFLSRAQLCMRFKNATGISVAKYISRKRLILARQKILQGKKPTDIFSECGYQDYSTFYRAYIRFFGHSPKQESEAYPVSAEYDRIDLF